MSKAPNRRFPRTARAKPEPRPTIERDKIRHRRPNDLLFEGDAEPSVAERRPANATGGGLHIDDGHDETAAVDWSDQGELASEPSDWDEESEDDWVLDGDDDQTPRDDGEVVYVEDEAGEADDGIYLDDGGDAGVVWEEDDYSEGEEVFEAPDEVAFGQPGQNFGFAPEVELAGRRDVSPKAPKPAPPPRPETPPQKSKRSARQQDQPQARRQQVDWSPQEDLHGSITPQGKAGFARRQPDAGPPPARPQAHSPAEARRFSQTRPPLEVVEDGVGDEQLLRQPRADKVQRRRQTHPAPAMPNTPGRRHPVRRGGGVGVLKLAVVALALLLIAGGGWFVYRSIGADGIQPLIDRVTAFLPVSNSTRTAADTPFDDQETPETISAEEALTRLENGGLQADEGVAATTPAPAAADEADGRTDGPPVPQFKPLPDGSAPVPAETPGAPGDRAQLAANDSEAGEEPSIFEQLWRYLSPG